MRSARDIEDFFKLLKCDVELKEKNKFLVEEQAKKLSNFRVMIEDNLHFKQRNEYSDLLELFLSNQIDTDNFSFCFIAQYDKTNRQLRDMEQNVEKNFDKLSSLLMEDKDQDRKSQIGTSLMFMYDFCDSFTSDFESACEDTINLKTSAKKLLNQLKQS